MDEDYAVVFDKLQGANTALIVSTACELLLFDCIEIAGHPLTAAGVAKSLGLHSDKAERLLNACVCIRVLHKEDGDGDSTYRNTPSTSKWLLKSRFDSLWGVAVTLKEDCDNYLQLSDKIRKVAGPSMQFSSPSDGKDENFYAATISSFVEEAFYRRMHHNASIAVPELMGLIDLSAYKSAVDLGGGTGAIGVAVSKRYPKMMVTVFERSMAQECIKKFIPPGLENVKWHWGDFFTDSTLPYAELYILGHVLHNWGEKEIDTILSKVYEALPSGGAILVLEKILHPSKTGPLIAVTKDLLMMTGMEGRERTFDEYTQLLYDKGFQDAIVKYTGDHLSYDAILAKK